MLNFYNLEWVEIFGVVYGLSTLVSALHCLSACLLLLLLALGHVPFLRCAAHMAASRLSCRYRRRKHEEMMEADHYDKHLVDSESTTSENIHRSNINNVYTTVEKRNHIRHIIEDSEDDSEGAGTEMYSLDDLPRVTALNDEDVHSIDSALLSATEQELVDSSSGDIDLSSEKAAARYSKTNSSSGYLSADDLGHRRASQVRRLSAVSATRRMSTLGYDGSLPRGERRISMVSQDGLDVEQQPATLRRSVSAFGEITVMPVGDDEDEELKIAVEEELYD